MVKCNPLPFTSTRNLSSESPLLGLKSMASEGPLSFSKNPIVCARPLWNSLKKVLRNDKLKSKELSLISDKKKLSEKFSHVQLNISIYVDHSKMLMLIDRVISGIQEYHAFRKIALGNSIIHIDQLPVTRNNDLKSTRDIWDLMLIPVK